MNTRRMSLALGSATGALLAAALLPVATSPVASADEIDTTTQIGSAEVSGIPPLFQDIQQQDLITAVDITTGASAHWDTAENNFSSPLIDNSQDYVYYLPTVAKKAFPDVDIPTQGTTTDDFAIAPFGFTLIGNDYTNIPGVGVTDDIVTPFGSFPIPIDLFSGLGTFDPLSELSGLISAF